MKQYVYTHQTGPLEQAYIFNTTVVNGQVKIHSIYLILKVNNQETKVILNVDNIIKDILEDPEAIAPEELTEYINQHFSDIDLEQQTTTSMLKAAELALEKFPVDFDKTINDLQAELKPKR